MPVSSATPSAPPPGPPPGTPTSAQFVPATATTARDAVTDAISLARFNTYLRFVGGGDVDRALRLYAWNVRVAGALFEVITHAEVALRNGVNRALVAAFDPSWPYNPGFERTFSPYDAGKYRADRADLEGKVRRSPLLTGDFVAGQTFAFWTSLLVKRYEARVWDAQFASSFRGATPSVGPAVTYKVVHSAAESLRRVRNRIAHHEPLLRIDPTLEYERALSVIGSVSDEKEAWVRAGWPPSPDFGLRP